MSGSAIRRRPRPGAPLNVIYNRGDGQRRRREPRARASTCRLPRHLQPRKLCGEILRMRVQTHDSRRDDEITRRFRQRKKKEKRCVPLAIRSHDEREIVAFTLLRA